MVEGTILPNEIGLASIIMMLPLHDIYCILRFMVSACECLPLPSLPGLRSIVTAHGALNR